jgi:hypothetical protein
LALWIEPRISGFNPQHRRKEKREGWGRKEGRNRRKAGEMEVGRKRNVSVTKENFMQNASLETTLKFSRYKLITIIGMM